MKHGLPLTPFQEQLFEIAERAFRYPSCEIMQFNKHIVSRGEAFNTECQMASPISKIDHSSKQGRYEKIIYWIVLLWEQIIAHIDGIFMSIMVVNIIWMYMITGQLNDNDPQKEIAELFKKILIVCTLIYIIGITARKVRVRWKRLRIWIEEK